MGVPAECWDLPNCLCLVRHNTERSLPPGEFVNCQTVQGQRREDNKNPTNLFSYFSFLFKFRLCYYSCSIFSYYFYEFKLSHKDIRKTHTHKTPNQQHWLEKMYWQREWWSGGGALFHKKSSRKNVSLREEPQIMEPLQTVSETRHGEWTAHMCCGGSALIIPDA